MTPTVSRRTARPIHRPTAALPGPTVTLRGPNAVPPATNAVPRGTKAILHGLATALLLACLSACDNGNGPTGPVAPAVVIAAPAPGSTVMEGSTVRFEGSATDPQDGRINGPALVWTSSIDGELGSGESLESTGLSVGIHTVVLSATDSDGNRGQASVSLGIQELDFLDGTVANAEIGLIVSTLGNTVRLFQVGDPGEQRTIPLGASSAVTPTGISVWGQRAAVPLGNAASVAILDLRDQQIEGFFLFESGNATGSAFVDHETVFVANQETDQVGSFRIGQASQTIQELVQVTPFPTDVLRVSKSLVLVISSNLDDGYLPAPPPSRSWARWKREA